tara:strand:- start:534 stop:1274 length:741 start_codon:yes stop_codon:yes gene_type:complete
MGLFDFFKSSSDKPRKENDWVSSLPPEIADQILQEIKSNPQACNFDEIPQGIGVFGHERTNPIPTYGLPSNELYLKSLRNKFGERLIWRRKQSVKVNNIVKPVDQYEIFSIEGDTIANLFLSPYHWKTSEKAPKGFKMVLSDREQQQTYTTKSSVENRKMNQATKNKIKEQIEQRLTKVVIEQHENNPLSDSPFEGLAIMEAITTYSSNYKKEFVANKDRLGLTEEEINKIIDEATSNVLNKFIEL